MIVQSTGNTVPADPRTLKGALRRCRLADDDSPGRTTFNDDDILRLTDPNSPDAQAIRELAVRFGDNCVVQDASSALRVAGAINVVLKSRVAAFPVWRPREGYTVVVCPLDDRCSWAFDPEIRQGLTRAHTQRGAAARVWMEALRGPAPMSPALGLALELFEECKATDPVPSSHRRPTVERRAAVLSGDGWLHVLDAQWTPPQDPPEDLEART